MVNGKMPLYLALLLATLSVAAVLTFQPCSADFPGTAYAKPAQRYIRAALRQVPIVLRFVASGKNVRVLAASSACLVPQ
jgi:hypothetical protein